MPCNLSEVSLFIVGIDARAAQQPVTRIGIGTKVSQNKADHPSMSFADSGKACYINCAQSQIVPSYAPFRSRSVRCPDSGPESSF